MNPPLACIIITTHRRPDLVATAVRSALAQTYDPLEIIVIDDNGKGTDAQQQTEKNLALFAKDARLRYLIQESNQGGAIARNHAATASRAKYITFLDDDDEYYPEKVATQVNALETEETDICLCTAEFYAPDSTLSHYKGLPVGRNLEEFLIKGHAMTNMIMVKRELYLAVGGFIKSPRYDDHLLMLRLLMASEKNAVIISTPHHRINLHDGERMSNNDKAHAAMINKHEKEHAAAQSLPQNIQRTVRHRQAREMLRFSIAEQGILRFFVQTLSLIVSARSGYELKESLRHAAKTAFNRYS